MRYVVWIDGWQLQCCGGPFEVGHEVAWTLSDTPNRDGLTAALGGEVAGRLTHAEDHHGALPDDLTATQGTVLAISSAFCRYAPNPERGNGQTQYPVPGSAVLRKVKRATGWEPEPPALRFNGYLVELRVVGPES